MIFDEDDKEMKDRDDSESSGITDSAKEWGNKAKDKASDMGENAKDKAQDMGNRAKDEFDDLG